MVTKVLKVSTHKFDLKIASVQVFILMLTDFVSKVKNAVICDLISWSPIGSSQRA